MCVFQSQSLLQMRSEMVSLQSELQCLSSTQQGELQAERDLNRTLQEKCQVRTLFFTLRPRYTQCKVLRGSGAIRTHPPFLPVSILSSFIFLSVCLVIFSICLPFSFLCAVSASYCSSSCLLRPSGHQYCKTNKVLEKCHYVNK